MGCSSNTPGFTKLVLYAFLLMETGHDLSRSHSHEHSYYNNSTARIIFITCCSSSFFRPFYLKRASAWTFGEEETFSFCPSFFLPFQLFCFLFTKLEPRQNTSILQTNRIIQFIIEDTISQVNTESKKIIDLPQS